MSVWWNKISSAAAIINDTIANISEERSVILSLPHDVPEYEYLQERIYDGLRTCNRSFRCLNGDDISAPAEYFYFEDGYLDDNIRMQYRPRPDETKIKFLARCDDAGFNNYLFYVKADRNAVKWVSFINEYNSSLPKRSSPHCVFMLELVGCDCQIPMRKNVEVVNWESYITSYDIEVYSMICSSELKVSAPVKRYIADLAAGLSRGRIELCHELIANGISLADNTAAVMRCTERDMHIDADEIVTDEDINKIMWMAQIKQVFPVIEDARMDYIKAHSAEIEHCLPIQSGYVTYEVPEDVEIGALCYLIVGKSIYATHQEYDALLRLRNARNRLAHIKSISFNELKEIIE